MNSYHWWWLGLTLWSTRNHFIVCSVLRTFSNECLFYDFIFRNIFLLILSLSLWVLGNLIAILNVRGQLRLECYVFQIRSDISQPTMIETTVIYTIQILNEYMAQSTSSTSVRNFARLPYHIFLFNIVVSSGHLYLLYEVSKISLIT